MSELFEKIDLKAELAKAEAEGAAPAKEETPKPVSEPREQPAAEPSNLPEGETPEPRDEGEKKVPHEALNAAREQQKALRKELEERTKREAVLEDRLNRLAEMFQKQQEPPPAPPNYETDPAGYLRYQQEQSGKSLDELRQQFQQDREARAYAEQTAHVQRELDADEAVFRQETPDYDKAADWMYKARDLELKEVWGIEDPAQRHAQIRQDFLAHVQACKRIGQSPARGIYAIAKQRGFSSEAQATGSEDKIAMLEKGQAAARSLSGAGGKAPARASLESLASMSDEEFRAATSGKNWAKLFGKA